MARRLKPYKRSYALFLVADFFLFGCHFLKGLGGNALFGTVRIVFIAFRNFSKASGPSIISGCGCFTPP